MTKIIRNNIHLQSQIETNTFNLKTTKANAFLLLEKYATHGEQRCCQTDLNAARTEFEKNKGGRS